MTSCCPAATPTDCAPSLPFDMVLVAGVPMLSPDCRLPLSTELLGGSRAGVGGALLLLLLPPQPSNKTDLWNSGLLKNPSLPLASSSTRLRLRSYNINTTQLIPLCTYSKGARSSSHLYNISLQLALHNSAVDIPILLLSPRIKLLALAVVAAVAPISPAAIPSTLRQNKYN